MAEAISEVKLKVGELTERVDYGRGIVRMSARDMKRVGVNEGDVVEIEGKRKTKMKKQLRLRCLRHLLIKGVSNTPLERGSTIGQYLFPLVAYLSLSIFSNIFDLSTGKGIFFQGFLSGILGIFSGVLVLYLFRNKEFFDIVHALRNKFWRNRVIAPEQAEL